MPENSTVAIVLEKRTRSADLCRAGPFIRPRTGFWLVQEVRWYQIDLSGLGHHLRMVFMVKDLADSEVTIIQSLEAEVV